MVKKLYMLQEKPLIFYIKIGAFSYMKKVRKKMDYKKNPILKSPKEIASEIVEQIKKLLPQENPLVINENLLNFNIEALVRRILNYCNRKDLPEAVKMSIIEQFYNKIISDNESNNLSEVDIRNLKRLKMNDTEFEFNFQEQVIVEKNSIYFFEQLKPMLNIYRKVRGFC
jgi:DNA polymerase III gamma/tau subunit